MKSEPLWCRNAAVQPELAGVKGKGEGGGRGIGEVDFEGVGFEAVGFSEVSFADDDPVGAGREGGVDAVWRGEVGEAGAGEVDVAVDVNFAEGKVEGFVAADDDGAGVLGVELCVEFFPELGSAFAWLEFKNHSGGAGVYDLSGA